MDDAARQAYFDGFKGSLGNRQLPGHLTSAPGWWTLRDGQGRTPLMLAANTRGVSSHLLATPGAEAILDAVDHAGHNLWFHLFQSDRVSTPALMDGWRGALDAVPAQPSLETGRGWMVDLALAQPRHFHRRAAPAEPMQGAWADLSSQPGRLFWAGTEAEAEAVWRQVFLPKRLVDGDFHTFRLPEVFRRARLATRTLGEGALPQWLPAPLREVLLFDLFLVGDERGDAWVAARQARGEPLAWSPAVEAWLSTQADVWGNVGGNLGGALDTRRLRQVLQDNRVLRLERAFPEAPAPSKRPRF